MNILMEMLMVEVAGVFTTALNWRFIEQQLRAVKIDNILYH